VLVASLTHSITQAVGDRGIYAIFLLMAVDAVFPAASELVMVYAGALAAGAISNQQVVVFGHSISSHAGAYLCVALAGTFGYLAGAWAGWAIGFRAGRPFVERHHRLFHLDAARLARADEWFRRRGRMAVLAGRVTPVVRSFVSIPAGLQRMPQTPYLVYTLIGSAIWSFALAGVGLGVGASYESFHRGFDYASIAIVAAVIVAVAALAIRHRIAGNRSR
jgi:membrane protein DedA with SNARE-associated domain